MKDCQLHTAKKAKQSHLANGTYPPKGFVVPGREKYYFKKGHKPNNKKIENGNQEDMQPMWQRISSATLEREQILQ